MAAEPAQYNRRATHEAPAPMRVNDAIIAQCANAVESKSKAKLRRLLLPIVKWRLAAAEIGEGYHWSFASYVRGARIGRYAYVGPGSTLAGPVSIGDLTMVSANVRLFGDDHLTDDPEVPMRYSFPTTGRLATVIEADCWIGVGALIKEGVTIRRGTVVAAGAVVVRDTPPYSIVGGVPAKLLRYRLEPAHQERHDVLLYGAVPADSIAPPLP